MRTTLASVPKVALAALTLRGTPAMAQEHAGTQSDQIYGGELSGDDLTNTQVSCLKPRLHDNVPYGARYTQNVTDMWGVQLSGGDDPTRASGVITRNLGLTTADLDVVWNFTPQTGIAAYAVAGAG